MVYTELYDEQVIKPWESRCSITEKDWTALSPSTVSALLLHAWEVVAETDLYSYIKDHRAGRPRREICETNPPKSCQICRSRFQRQRKYSNISAKRMTGRDQARMRKGQPLPPQLDVKIS